MGEDISYEEHVAINNTRLSSIRASLTDVSTFSQACVELTKWCSDQRAFTAHFEDNLMSALNVAMENGTKETFDFELTHQLVSACFSHRKHLSKASANRINRWYEQLRRMKKNGGKRKRAPPKNSAANAAAAAAASTASSGIENNTSNGPTMAENNNFMCVDGSMMWGGPQMGTPGSSAQFAPQPPPAYPGAMTPSYATPNGGLPYGQMEGNHAMYDQQQQQQRMMSARMAGPQPTGYPMAQMPGQPGQQMMRYPGSYPPTGPQYPGAQPMMRAAPIPAHVFNQLAAQNMSNMDIRRLYDQGVALKIQQPLTEEFLVNVGTHGAEIEVNGDVVKMLQTDAHSDVLCQVWQQTATNEPSRLEVFLNNNSALLNTGIGKSAFVKSLLNAGKNMFHYTYEAKNQLHKISCDFVVKTPISQLRDIIRNRSTPEMANQSRNRYIMAAQSRGNGFVSIPLNCPMTKRRMLFPVRHRNCPSVASAFELATLLSNAPMSTRYQCYHCGSFFKFDELEMDGLITYFVQALQSQPYVTDLIIGKDGAITGQPMLPPMNAVPHQPPPEEKEKPKRGKKKAAPAPVHHEDGAHTIKRIKSESFVKQEPHWGEPGGQVAYSPMPGSLPSHDWPKLQSPFAMISPNMTNTPKTPMMINGMCSPRMPPQTMNCPPMGVYGQHIGATTSNDQHMVGTGSAPYTPNSVGVAMVADKLLELTFQMDRSEFFRCGMPVVYEGNKEILFAYLKQTGDAKFEEIDTSVVESQSLSSCRPASSNPPTANHLSSYTPPSHDDKHHHMVR